MAEDKNIAFELEVKGAEQSINSVKELKKAIQAAKDEQLKAASAFGVGSKEFTKASQAVAELKDKVEDLADATESVKGSGVESVGKSFSQLGDGLKNLDLDKVKTGFSGIGKAMSAIPLILLVQGVQYLVEKFEIFKIIGEAVEKLFYALTDAIGLTHKAAEEQSKALIAGMKEQEIAIQNRYDSEIKLAKAAGKITTDLEIEKLTAVETSSFNQLNVLKNLLEQKGKLNEDELKEYNTLQFALLKATTDKNAAIIADEKQKNEALKKVNEDFSKSTISISEALRKSKLSIREQEIEAVKEAAAVQLKSLNDISTKAVDNEFEYKRLKQAEIDLAALTASKISEINNKYYLEELAKNKIHLDEKNRQALENEKSLNEALKSLSEVQRTERLEANKDEGDLKLQQIDAVRTQEYEDHVKFEKEKQQATFDITQKSVEGAMALSDLYFAYKKNGLKKGSAEELAFAKKQFEVNKGLAIASAGIQGIQTVMAAYASGVATPIIGAATGPVYAALAGIVVAANIAKLASAKFDGGGGGAGSAASPSLPSAPSIPPPPGISTQANNTNQNTLFDDDGKRIGGDPTKRMSVNVTATVGVNEIAEKSNRVQVLENQSTF